AESSNFEKTVQELSTKLAEKARALQLNESKLADALTTINRAEIRLSNEVSSRDLVIKTLEHRVKDQKKALDSSENLTTTLEREQRKWKLDAEAHAKQQLETQIQLATKEFQRENAELQRQLAEREEDESAFMQEIDKLKIMLQEAKQAQINEKENFDMQLHLLEQRGKLQASEIKKIGDLNAELFGHSNTRQKIKHVAQLKEENVTLREQNLGLNREKDLLKRKLMNMERELESFKSVGLTSRKTSRVGRSFLQDSRMSSVNGSNSILAELSDKKPNVNTNGDKENNQLYQMNATGGGGISYIFE
ncbi:hypothetical protein HDU91_000810, partial [Kappamyces sp. JEL0680]